MRAPLRLPATRAVESKTGLRGTETVGWGRLPSPDIMISCPWVDVTTPAAGPMSCVPSLGLSPLSTLEHKISRLEKNSKGSTLPHPEFAMSKDQKLFVIEGASSSENDGFELPNISKLGSTAADEHEMRMLGRTQVLNVRDPRSWTLSVPQPS